MTERVHPAKKQLQPRKAVIIWSILNVALTLLFSFSCVYLILFGSLGKIFLMIISIIVFIGMQIAIYYLLIAKPFRILHCSLESLKVQASNLNLQEYLYASDDIYTVLFHLSDILKTMHAAVNEDYKEELLNRQAQFAMLQSQINPHFLYNTLDSIRGQALIEGSKDIAEMTQALSSFFRYNISQKGDFVTLREELKNVENYFLIQKYRFIDRFKFIVKMEDERALDYMIPKLTIQPIIENSIYHGLEPKPGIGHIRIRIILTDKRMIIIISDDGIGMDEETLTNQRNGIGEQEFLDKSEGRHSGIALRNVDRRIKLYCGSEYGLRLSSTLSLGTEVEIQIPLVTSNKNQKVFGKKNYEA